MRRSEICSHTPSRNSTTNGLAGIAMPGQPVLAPARLAFRQHDIASRRRHHRLERRSRLGRQLSPHFAIAPVGDHHLVLGVAQDDALVDRLDGRHQPCACLAFLVLRGLQRHVSPARVRAAPWSARPCVPATWLPSAAAVWKQREPAAVQVRPRARSAAISDPLILRSFAFSRASAPRSGCGA